MRLLSYPATPRWSSAVQPLGSVPCFSLPFRHGFSRRSKKSHSRSPLGMEAVVKRHFRGLRLHSPIAQQRTMKRATSLSEQVSSAIQAQKRCLGLHDSGWPERETAEPGLSPQRAVRHGLSFASHHMHNKGSRNAVLRSGSNTIAMVQV